MKKYVSGFLFFFIITLGSLIGLFFITMDQTDDQTRQVQATEAVEQQILAGETDSEPIHLVLNQHSVQAKVKQERYYLMAEEGYLIIYDQEQEKVELITRMSVSEFPLAEQERLVEGIWFTTMTDLFSYLESCTS